MTVNEVEDVTVTYEINDEPDDFELAIINSVTVHNEYEDMMNSVHQAYLEELYAVDIDIDEDIDDDDDDDDDDEYDPEVYEYDYSDFVSNDNETLEELGQDKYDSSNKYKL